MPRIAACIALALALCVHAGAHAQDYPSRPVRIIVPTTAAGLTDLAARLLAQKLGAVAKQPFVVENRPGGGGTIGAEAVARSAPDGYTLLMGFHGVNAILPALGAKMPLDPVRDLDPVVLLITVPNVLVVGPNVAASTVQELVALARARPGTLTFASQGNGSSGHLAGELFRISTGIEIVHVPYKGPAEAIRDVMNGQVTMMFDVVTLALPNVKAGKVRALAVATRERVAAAGDIPSMAEAGLPAVEVGAWFALYAPAKTPRPVIDWLNAEAVKAFGDPEIRDRFTAQGSSVPLGPPEALGSYAANELARWRRVGQAASIRLD